MKKLSLLFIISLLAFGTVMGGEAKKAVASSDSATAPKTVVKMNLSSLALLTFSFQAEHSFHRRMSAALGYYVITPFSIPKGLGVGDFASGRFSGYAITPEFRYFPGNKEKAAPNGFYLAPYFRYSKYQVTGAYSDFQSNFFGSFTGVSKAYGGGLMIGSQWLIGDHFSIDLYIVGFHFGKRKYSIEVQNSQIPSFNQTDQQEIVDGALLLLNKYADIDAQIDNDKLSLKFNTGHWGFRGVGLNVGFAF